MLNTAKNHIDNAPDGRLATDLPARARSTCSATGCATHSIPGTRSPRIVACHDHEHGPVLCAANIDHGTPRQPPVCDRRCRRGLRLMERDEARTRFCVLRAELVATPLVRRPIVKTAGDGMLLEFSSAAAALRYAIDSSETRLRYRDLAPDHRVALRMGINLGDIIVEGDDIAGAVSTWRPASKPLPNRAASAYRRPCAIRCEKRPASVSTTSASNTSRTSQGPSESSA
jgi:hypothetical protein